MGLSNLPTIMGLFIIQLSNRVPGLSLQTLQGTPTETKDSHPPKTYCRGSYKGNNYKGSDHRNSTRTASTNTKQRLALHSPRTSNTCRGTSSKFLYSMEIHHNKSMGVGHYPTWLLSGAYYHSFKYPTTQTQTVHTTSKSSNRRFQLSYSKEQ